MLTFSTRSVAALSLMPRYVAMQITLGLRSVCGISPGFCPQGRLIYASPLLILPTGRSPARFHGVCSGRTLPLLGLQAPGTSAELSLALPLSSSLRDCPSLSSAFLFLVLSAWLSDFGKQTAFSGLKVRVWEVWRISSVAQIACLHWRLV